MATHRLEITLNEADWARLEECRGHEPRASFVKRALRDALAPESRPNSMPADPPEGFGVSEKKVKRSSVPSIADTWRR